MISKISGKLVAHGEGSVEVAVDGLTYELQVPAIVAQELSTLPGGESLHFETIYYLQMEQARATPVLLGFLNTIQKEFFEKLLLVPRMGPKGALVAFARPVSTIASAIERADYQLLQTLPGVGKQKARDLVATLQGKVARFALMQDSELGSGGPAPAGDSSNDAMQMLLALGHKRAEAEKLVAAAQAADPAATDAEALVRAIYRLKQK
jgi:Holliday junction DNA helicase RuvA